MSTLGSILWDKGCSPSCEREGNDAMSFSKEYTLQSFNPAIFLPSTSIDPDNRMIVDGPLLMLGCLVTGLRPCFNLNRHDVLQSCAREESDKELNIKARLPAWAKGKSIILDLAKKRIKLALKEEEGKPIIEVSLLPTLLDFECSMPIRSSKLYPYNT